MSNSVCPPCKRNNPPVCYADMPPLHKGAYETLSLPCAGVAMATPREVSFAQQNSKGLSIQPSVFKQAKKKARNRALFPRYLC